MRGKVADVSFFKLDQSGLRPQTLLDARSQH